MYEIVQLLRINGAQIKRAGTHAFTLRLGDTGNWHEHKLTVREIKQRYGYGSIGYKALRTHQRADRVPVAKLKRKVNDIIWMNESQHADLA